MNNFYQNNGMQQQQLPHSAEVVYTPNMAHNLPHNPTTFPNVPVSPNMQPYIRMICGYTMKELQENAARNNLRVFSFNLFSANNWMTQEFAQLVSMVSDYAEVIVAMNNVNAEVAIANAAQAMVTWMTAVLPSRFNALMNYVNQDIANELQNLMNGFQQATSQIQQFKQRGVQMQQPQQQPWNNNQNWGQNNNNNSFNGGFGVPLGISNPVVQAPNIPVGSMFSTAPQVRDFVNHNDSLNMAPAMGTHVPAPVNEIVDLGFSPNAAPVIVTAPAVVDTKPAKKLPERIDHLGMRLALIPDTSMITRKWCIEVPYSFAFDKQKHVMFLNMVDDTQAFEIIKSVEDVGVEYINHELDPTFHLKAYQNALPVERNIKQDWDKVTNTVPVKQIEANEARDKELEINTSIYLHERHLAASLPQAIEIAKMKLKNKGIKLSGSSPFEFTYRKINPFYIEDRYIDIIKEIKPSMREINTYADAYSFMKSVNGMIPTEIWNYLNMRLTDSVNNELTKGMGFKLTMNSFYLELNELFDWLEKKGPGIKNTFLTTQQDVVSTIFKLLVKDGLNNYISSIGGTFTEESEFKHLVFFEDYFVVLVPWEASKIDIVLHENNGAVMESFLPNMFNALKQIVDKSNVQKIYNRLIITSDGAHIEVSEGTFSKDVYIISRS